jgi:Bacterial PH domain
MTVTSRPVRTTKIAIAAAVVVCAVFVVVAIVMPHANAGAHFSWKDQLATAVLGVILSGLILVFTRPRLRADENGVHIRNHWGPYKTIPWDLIVRVEFPKGRHFARLVLPADETIPLYAVQRSDRERSVAVMRDLRELLARSHRP